MRALTCVSLCVACGGSPKGGALSASLPEGAVLDPRLQGAPTLALVVDADEGAEGCALTAQVEGPTGQQRTWSGEALWREDWDGLDDDGLPFDVGAARLIAACDGVEPGGADLVVLRLGLSAVDLGAGPDGGQVALAWHRRSLTQREIVPIDEGTPELRIWGDDGYQLADLDDNAGAPRSPPPPWTDASVPPWDDTPTLQAYNAPAAYVADTRIGLTVTAGARAVSARTLTPVEAVPSDAPPLRLLASGLSPDDGEGLFTPGAALAFTADAPVEDTLGRDTLTLDWRWQAWDGAAWIDVPGQLETQHRIWRLAGQPQLRDGADLGFAPATVWVAALEELQPDLQGVPADTASILDAIRDHINHDPYLIYNPSDSAYSDYKGSYIYWDYIWSDLGVWLDRTEGIDLYCHSVSCLFSVLAGHWGVYAPQQVLGVGFNTNYTLAAGTDTWKTWSFNSHSVVSPDDGLTVWDASIDLDGDGAPGSSPSEALSPKGLSLEEYLSLLTAGDIGIVNSGLCYFE